MVMISSTPCDAGLQLLGCGVDAEDCGRFRKKFDGTTNPLPLIFTDQEIRFARRQDDPAAALCAAFCAKEALLKAIGHPFNPHDCVCKSDGSEGELPLFLSSVLLKEYRIEEVQAVLRCVPDNPDTLLVTICLLGTVGMKRKQIKRDS